MDKWFVSYHFGAHSGVRNRVISEHPIHWQLRNKECRIVAFQRVSEEFPESYSSEDDFQQEASVHLFLIRLTTVHNPEARTFVTFAHSEEEAFSKVKLEVEDLIDSWNAWKDPKSVLQIGGPS